ncbi:hypothetical protein PIROE2DRAFT_60234 [Piromyces sp. E2]|nr:hypothetical protein PIROE2DRAFT_60234 [Piromyces sp. E2]|eukprot:OUM65127.1 hypothetical protein PIROE2DRAFT_60234 [Piromyces sp. E2]
MSIEQEDTIKTFIKSNNKKELKSYIEINDIDSNNFNDFKNLILYSIENNASEEILEYINSKRKDPGYNFYIKEDNNHTTDNYFTPLSVALTNYNFELANFLINNNADFDLLVEREDTQEHPTDTGGTNSINDDDDEEDDEKDENPIRLNIIDILPGVPNKRILKFLFDHGLNKFDKNIKKRLIEKVILCFLDDSVDDTLHHHIRFIGNIYKYNNDGILDLLHLYRRSKVPNTLSMMINKNFKEVIAKQNTIHFMDLNYQFCIDNHDYELLKILFEYDGCEEEDFIHKIDQYNILKGSVETGDYAFVEKVLRISSNPSHLNDTKEEEEVVVGGSGSGGGERSYIPYLNVVLNIAIRMNNFDLVHYLMDSEDYHCTSDDINRCDVNEEYPILTAVEEGTTEILQYLLEHGATINLKSKSGYSLVHLAVLMNKKEMVEVLLKKKTNIDITERYKDGSSLLMKAVNSNNTEIVQYLIDYASRYQIKLNINEWDINKNSLIDKALMNNNNDMVKRLMDYASQTDTNIMKNCGNGNNPLIIAIMKKNYVIVSLLIQYGLDHGINMNEGDREGRVPLMFSYLQRDFTAFRYLLNYFDVNSMDSKNNKNVLYYAVGIDDVNGVENLVSLGSTIDIKHINLAISKGNYQVLKALLKKDNYYDVGDCSEDNPLIHLIQSKNFTVHQVEEMTKNFIKKGLNINYVDRNQNSPLAHAIMNNNMEIVKVLVENGSNININIETTWKTVNVVNYTLDYKYDEIAMVLIENGVDMEQVTDECFKNIIVDGRENLLRAIHHRYPLMLMRVGMMDVLY